MKRPKTRMDAMRTLMKRREELMQELDNLKANPEGSFKFQKSATASREQTSRFQKSRRTLLKKIEELDNKLEKFPDPEKRFP